MEHTHRFIPALGADKTFQAPQVARATLDNGLEVLVVERDDLPKVAVSFVTRAGVAADPDGKEGLANLTMTTIDLGTKSRKALEIEDEKTAMAEYGSSDSGASLGDILGAAIRQKQEAERSGE